MKPLTLQAVLGRGLTYRRLDWWTRQRWLRPTHAGGTGHNRAWPQAELQIADLMRRLIDGGLNPADAASAARTSVEEERLLVVLGPGLVLAIDTDLLTEAGERCG